MSSTPHEPFDTPEPWAIRYGEPVDGERIVWPPYAIDAVAEDASRQPKGARCAITTALEASMIDHWLGRVLTALEEQGAAKIRW